MKHACLVQTIAGLTLIVTFLSIYSPDVYAKNIPSPFHFKRFTTINGLPSNDIQKIYQSRDGYIWIASKNGLFRYDGHSIRTYKSNLHNPNMLSNNNIFCLADDWNHQLWIGSYKGLNRLNRKTGKMYQVVRKEFVNNSIPAILATRDNRLLIGTDQGLYHYMYEQDSCVILNQSNTGGVFPVTAIKELFEDSRGHVWIGTWSNGLYRYDPAKDCWYAYPRMNAANSAHAVFEDSRGRIWVGSWGHGLHLLYNAYDPENVSWKTYTAKAGTTDHLASDVIYDISEDIHNGNIWVGTPWGVSVLADEQEGRFVNYYPGDSDSTISHNEVNSIIRDNQGMMWLGLLGGGINTVVTRKQSFKTYNLGNVKKDLNTNSITSLYIGDDELMWIGIGNSGLMQYDRSRDKYKHQNRIEGFRSFDRMASILSITHIATRDQLWIGTYNTGVLVYDTHATGTSIVTKYPYGETPWLPGGRVYAIYEDSYANIWLGTNNGPALLMPDNHYLRLDSLQSGGKRLDEAIITDIEEGTVPHEMWVASNNYGIFKISGQGRNIADYRLTGYSAANGKLNSTNVSCVYKDSKDRIWACSEGSGLNLYHPDEDTFIPVHQRWNLPGDAVYNMVEDEYGSLWMGTNTGLIKLEVKDDATTAIYRLYTTSDGLCDNSFTRRSMFRTPDGEIFIGGHQGLNSFYPAELTEDASVPPSPIAITDIKIHNRSLNDLEESVRHSISALTPEYTEAIRLGYRHNNFNIEFAALGYETPAQHKYAYKLDGFDTGWHFTDAARRFAYYNNLNPGTYRFQLKSTNANGIWNEQIRTLQITILPPPWKSWWAYLIYMLLAATIAFFLYRMFSNRIKLRNALQLREIEKEKAEELNHAKLQFFTNITHELLTPLSIISASVDELKKETPQYADRYRVMTGNINRLIRLLQQILEFRKAETGNLKLRVSQGDLAAFIINNVDSFRPLIKKKQMNFSVDCALNPFTGWFDPDKIDKILYNLLSNAAKYNKPEGNIYVNLFPCKDGYASITVRDEGPGISKEAQQNLFKRFYEGDYRKFKTIGTGIGLSLTKDLVILHRGAISVESRPGQGTTFTVEIPVMRAAYKDDEIDDTITTIEPSPLYIAPAEDEPEDKEITTCHSPHLHSILLIEDNEDLLSLMVKLLGTEYNIYTAGNGQGGLEIILTEDIDLVVSDIMMPVMDGVTLCQQLKNNIETSHIPVLLLTAKTGEADRINAYESGADSYLNKPFNLNVLNARIANLLKAREQTGRDFKKQLVFEARELNYTSLDEAFIQKAIDCIHSHLDDPDYDQAGFVKDMATSRSTLFRKMKSLTGMSYVSFIRNIRLKAACRIMEEKGHIRVSELAYAVGFNDPRYFSTCFKKEFGMQPREYFERFVRDDK